MVPSPSCIHTGSFVFIGCFWPWKELGTFLGLIPSNSRLTYLEEKSFLGLAGRFQVARQMLAGACQRARTWAQAGGAEQGPRGSALRLRSHQ